jgi:hypothetical protein
MPQVHFSFIASSLFFLGRPPFFPFSRAAATFAGERERPPLRPAMDMQNRKISSSVI